jgi:hypothetical protein
MGVATMQAALLYKSLNGLQKLNGDKFNRLGKLRKQHTSLCVCAEPTHPNPNSVQKAKKTLDDREAGTFQEQCLSIYANA